MDPIMTAGQRATDAAGWTLTSLGIVTSTAIQQWTLALGTATAGLILLGLNVVLKVRKAMRDEEISQLRHQIDVLHLKAEEKAEQSRESWAIARAETASLKDEIVSLKVASSHAMPVTVITTSTGQPNGQAHETAQPGGGDPK
jgi:hypothetical protein